MRATESFPIATTSSPSGLNDALVTGFSHGTEATSSPPERQIFRSRPPLVTTADPLGSRDAVRTGAPVSQSAEPRAGTDVPHPCRAVLSRRDHPASVG